MPFTMLINNRLSLHFILVASSETIARQSKTIVTSSTASIVPISDMTRPEGVSSSKHFVSK